MARFFGFFDFTKEGPGIRKNGPKKKIFFVFFETFFRNFWRFITINVVYVGLSMLIFTRGMTGAGLTNITRNIARDKHSFGISDFFTTIKKNLKQSIIVGIINTFIDIVLLLSVWTYFNSWMNVETSSTFNLIGFGVSLAMSAIFAMCKFYIYTLMITFNYTVKTLYVNSFKFVFLCFWKNILCGLILILTLLLYLFIFLCFPMWITLFIEIFLLMLTYPAYKFLLIQFFTFGSIKKYIIDPYYKEHPDADIEKRRALGLEVPDDDEEEPLSWE